MFPSCPHFSCSPSQYGFYVDEWSNSIFIEMYKIHPFYIFVESCITISLYIQTRSCVCETHLMLFCCCDMCEAAGKHVSRTYTCERFLTSKTVPQNVGSPSSLSFLLISLTHNRIRTHIGPKICPLNWDKNSCWTSRSWQEEGRCTSILWYSHMCVFFFNGRKKRKIYCT